jgi:hypothetical protein
MHEFKVVFTLLVPDQGDSQMPLAATVATPCCLLCGKSSHLPPAKTAWISASDVETIAVICSDCDCPDQAELEAKIVAQVSGAPAAPKADISTAPMVGVDTHHAKWAARAAAKWAEPLTRPRRPNANAARGSAA